MPYLVKIKHETAGQRERSNRLLLEPRPFGFYNLRECMGKQGHVVSMLRSDWLRPNRACLTTTES